MSKVVSKVTDTLFGKPKEPEAPEAQVPAPPAPSRREDSGANIVIGSDKSQRVSGRAKGGSTSTSRISDIIGGLGKGGGLSI